MLWNKKFSLKAKMMYGWYDYVVAKRGYIFLGENLILFLILLREKTHTGCSTPLLYLVYYLSKKSSVLSLEYNIWNL